MFSRDELRALKKIGLPDYAWYTKSGIKAAKKGAEDALEQSKE